MNQQEHKLQVQICKWLEFTQNFYWFAIPNGGLRNKAIAIKLKMEGLKAGVADMFWMIPNKNWNGIFVEVKVKGNYQQPNQKTFEKVALSHRYYYAVVRSIEDCDILLKKYKANLI